MKKTIKFVALMLMLSLFLIGCEPPIETLRIKFDSNGGSTIYPRYEKPGSKLDCPIPIKEGYFLEGWYTSLDGGETLDRKWIFETDTITGELFLYAKWEEIFPIIRFYSNGGSQVSKIVQRQGEAIEAPLDPIREGYDFAGWYSDQDLENYFIFDKMPKVDITLYADWGTEGLEYILLSEDTYGVSKGTCLATSVKIPKRHMGKLVTNIVDEAFSACDNLENIVIPSSVTSIGDEAFSACDNLENIVIPSSVTSIGTDAFRNCTSLTSITIPNSVTNIGAEAFYNCESIIFYAQVESKPEGWDENFNLYNRPVIWGYISNDITTDGYEYGVSLIDSVYSVIITRYKGNYVGLNIPEKIKGYDVKEIGNFAFSDCNNLMNVRIPSTVTSIGIGSFSSCVKLSKIIIPSTVTNIGAEAFYNCESIIFYAQATTKPEGWDENFNLYNRPVIWGCISTGYTEGYLEYLVVQNGSVYNVIITKYSGSSISLKIPEKIEGYEVIGVGEKAFNYCTSIISIKLPDSITSIGAFAFNNCTKLVSINMPTSLTSIGEGAFRNCNKVIIANLPNGVTKIEKNVFENCSNLTSIVIPATVTSIGEGAFRVCVSLTNVKMSNNLTSIGEGAFRSCVSLTNITIPNAVTKIEAKVFENCLALTNVVMPNSVTSIENSAFNNCKSLVGITLSTGLINIGEAVFENCTSLKNIAIPASVTNIGDRVFRNCTSLVNIAIPDGVTEIGIKVFSNCESLTNVVLSNNITSIGGWTFFNASNLTNITLPSSLKSIGDLAFARCTGLTSIIIPNSVISIGNSAFSKCTNLASVTISSNIVSIGAHAFSECSSLTSIVIPSSTIYMGKSVFIICYDLIIYSETIRKPDGWDEDWVGGKNTVIWGYGKD